jgi:hypothetical protein
MTFTEAAAEVLRLAGKPLHYKEITELAIEKNLLSHVGKSPEVTMGARLAALLKKEDKTNPIVRVKPGVFALREWGEKGAAARAPEAEDDSELEVNALEVEAATAASDEEAREDDEGGDDEAPMNGDDALRADLAASGADFFDDEDDDDQPILAPVATNPAGGAAPSADGAQSEGGRRRRRRRRRGRGGDRGDMAPREGAPLAAGSQASLEGGEGTPEVARDPLAPAPRPQIRDRQQIMSGGLPSGIEVPLTDGDELAGRELADAAHIVFAAFDRNGGPVALRSLVDQLMRRGRLVGDPAACAVQLSASMRADNLRREAIGARPRFRFASGARVAPTDWILGQELQRFEMEALQALERYRDAARRVFLRRIQELPGHAFIELALLALERAGMAQLRGVRRAGVSGGEAHFGAIHKTGADEIRTAIVVRKDGREIGRERVSDLRGALHHYGPATAGWLITTGQVLSGAREEAATPNAPPVALYDGLAFCKLLEDNGVAVLSTKQTIAIPDLELLENLRG